ncbi:cobalamin biosynthesis protein [Rubellimicrobium rubrum]|uniref:Cobalamin biosynthesis protein CobD n=1 Tax=Rubellimicrobium rubrum TaxID=2585369 RepID=A0A5C4MUV2_9RHOB|nr:adenosylcobinamide-phosphate synthase CbiB [Rubellimicrobium rubrum]TNC49887.1 cobalamin biosynthesis protein [Rubellimicrobium rubrum]
MSLVLALLLDAIFGEPRALWDRWAHPAVLMGRAVAWADERFNEGGNRRWKGVLALGLLVVAAMLLGWALAALPGSLAEVIVGAILLAQRSLADHVQAVARALRLSLPEGRRTVAMIVGRDTASMDEPAVARAAVESAAENFSDGVVAPAFWFAVAGLPGLLIYKLVNTADSMIGHRTPRYEQFGWAAARLDDGLNLIPARLSAALIWLTRPRAAWGPIIRDARLHRSPNAGWPEAAMARVLDVALSGPRSYHGTMQDLPWVHPQGRKAIGAAEVHASVRVLWQAWAILLLLALLLVAF